MKHGFEDWSNRSVVITSLQFYVYLYKHNDYEKCPCLYHRINNYRYFWVRNKLSFQGI